MTCEATELSKIKSLSNVNDMSYINCEDELYDCGNLDDDIPSTLSKLKLKTSDIKDQLY